MMNTTYADQIASLWARERELLAELNAVADPLERAETVEAGLELIARRRAARDELEAVRACRHHLEELAREAATRERELTTVRESIADLEARLPKAIAQDEQQGSMAPVPSNEEQCRRNLAAFRRRLMEIEAGGPLPVGVRM